LADVKANTNLANMALVKMGRLSVQPVTEMEWEEVLKMSQGL
jgi:predicted RNA-binding protein with PUA-like domain